MTKQCFSKKIVSRQNGFSFVVGCLFFIEHISCILQIKHLIMLPILIIKLKCYFHLMSPILIIN